jgi:putative permease
MNVLSRWFKKTFSDPEIVILTGLLVGLFAVIIFLGKPLAPFLASVVVAYLLESVVKRLEALGLRRLWAVTLVFAGFVAILIALMLVVVPTLSTQITQLVQRLPDYLDKSLQFIQALPQKYPRLINEEQAQTLISRITTELTSIGQGLLKHLLSSFAGIFSILIFFVLMPILVFFLLKDKETILSWVRRFLPRDSRLTLSIWKEVDTQIGNYVRGKVLEIIIVGLVSYIVFASFGLQYAILLATLTGFSVLVPYIGAAVVTIPIAVVAFFQFGWSDKFLWLMAIYGLIQLLDGNVLVPFLFSEVNNLHPVAIILAVLFFGGIWGFWGVFFAIPLATLVNAILNAWPKSLPEKNKRPRRRKRLPAKPVPKQVPPA